MDTEYLRTFCEVAKQKNFRKAADELKVTQPCISRRIRSLESELGVVLLERTTHAVTLTEEGKNFLPYAEHTVNVISEGWRRIVEGEKDNQIKVAATPTTSFNWLPDVIADFYFTNNMRLKVHTATSPEVFDMVLDQRIDIGITTIGYSNPQIEQEVILSEELVFVGNPEFVDRYFTPDHRWKGERIPIITSSQLWDLVDDLFQLDQPLFSIVVEAYYVQVAEALARRGLGLALLPRSVASEAIAAGSLKQVGFENFTVPTRPVYLLYVKGTMKRRLINSFKESIARINLEALTPQ